MLKTLLQQSAFIFWAQTKEAAPTSKKRCLSDGFRLITIKKMFSFIYKVLDISFGMSRTELSFNILIHKLFQSSVGGAALWIYINWRARFPILFPTNG